MYVYVYECASLVHFMWIKITKSQWFLNVQWKLQIALFLVIFVTPIFSCAHFSNFSCTQWHLKTQIPLFILVLNDPLLLKLCLLLISPCRRLNYHATMNVKNCIIWSIKPSLIVLLAPVLDISQGTWTSSSSIQKIPLSTILCQRQETQQEWHKGVPFSFYTSETKFKFGHILHMVCWISTKLRS